MPNKVQFNHNYPDITKSNKLYERATGLIPAYSQTLAKGPSQFVDGVAPKYLQRAKGARVWDVDGNEYIDYTLALGPISLGHGYPATDEAIKKQLEDGITYSMVHPLEVEVAELIREVIPNAQSVRYSKTGAEATSAAIRVARAFTGRDKVLCCGYHGWHDWYAGVLGGRTAGIPQAVKNLVHTFAFNDIDTLHASLDEETACVIMEPMVFDWPNEGFLAQVQEACRQNGTLLILDEMWTGFRMALGGAQEHFGITPDLACYSKAIANGMPLAVLTGRQDVMSLLDEDIFFFSTFGGEALSLAAAQATINEMRQHNVQQVMAQKGQMLLDGYNEIANELSLDHFTQAKGYPARTVVTFDASAGDPLLMKSLVQQELFKRGILWSGFQTICYTLTEEDVAYTLEAFRDVLPILKKAAHEEDIASYLHGKPVQPTFRRTSGFHSKPKQAER